MRDYRESVLWALFALGGIGFVVLLVATTIGLVARYKLDKQLGSPPTEIDIISGRSTGTYSRRQKRH